MSSSTKTYFALFALVLASMTFGCSNKVDQASTLDPRFQSNDSVQFVQDGTSVASYGDVSAFASSISVSLSLTISPPPPSATGGQQVYASDLQVYDNNLITTYNVPGNVQRGWVDLIDVTSTVHPNLRDSQYFPDTDINSVAIASDKFALIGAKEGVGTVLRTGTYDRKSLALSATETFPTGYGSYAGTGITYDSTGTNLAFTSGDTGGVNVVNSATLANISAAVGVTDARGITYHAPTNKYYVVKGQSGEVMSFNSSGAYVATTTIGGATIAQSKSTIMAGNEFLLATSGDGGFTVLCASDLGIAAQQAQFVYSNYAALGLPGPTLTVSNAAAFGPGMIFVAAGQAGVRIYNFVKKSGVSPTACQNVQVSYMGYFAFSSGVSANNLAYKNLVTNPVKYIGTLYLADGGGGFKAVKIDADRSALNDIVEF